MFNKALNSLLVCSGILLLFAFMGSGGSGGSTYVEETGAAQRWQTGNLTPIADVTPVVIATAHAGYHHYVEAFSVSNSSASVGTDVELLDGTNRIGQCPGATNYGGCVVAFPYPRPGTINTALSCHSVTTGAAVKCFVWGYDSLIPGNTPTVTPTPTPTRTPTATPTP